MPDKNDINGGDLDDTLRPVDVPLDATSAPKGASEQAQASISRTDGGEDRIEASPASEAAPPSSVMRGVATSILAVAVGTGAGAGAYGASRVLNPGAQQPETVPAANVAPRVVIAVDNPVAPETSRLLQGESVRLLYNEGFKAIMGRVSDNVPDGATVSKDPANAAIVLGKIKKLMESMQWVLIGESGYLDMHPTGGTKGFLAVYGPDSSNVLDGPAAMLDRNPPSNVIKIKPYNMSLIWAGITLVGSLANLADRLGGVEPQRVSHHDILWGEISSAQVQLMAINNMTKNHFLYEAVKLLAEYRFKNVDEIINLAKNDPKIAAEIIERMERTIPAVAARSQEERAMRNKMYVIALCFALVDRHVKNIDEREAGYRRTIVELNKLNPASGAGETKANKL